MENISKKLKLAPIHELLPTEILVMILKKLGYKSLSFARFTCKNWKKVIDEFGLAKAALGKFEIIKKPVTNDLSLTIIIIFSKGVIHNHCWRLW